MSWEERREPQLCGLRCVTSSALIPASGSHERLTSSDHLFPVAGFLSLSHESGHSPLPLKPCHLQESSQGPSMATRAPPATHLLPLSWASRCVGQTQPAPLTEAPTLSSPPALPLPWHSFYPLGLGILTPAGAPLVILAQTHPLDPSTLDHVCSYWVSLPSPARLRMDANPAALTVLTYRLF